MEVPSKYRWLWFVHLHLVAIPGAEAEEVVIEEEEEALVEDEVAVDEEEETAEMENNQIFKEGQETGGKWILIPFVPSYGRTRAAFIKIVLI